MHGNSKIVKGLMTTVDDTTATQNNVDGLWQDLEVVLDKPSTLLSLEPPRFSASLKGKLTGIWVPRTNPQLIRCYLFDCLLEETSFLRTNQGGGQILIIGGLFFNY